MRTKIVRRSVLKDIVGELRLAGKTIVFTNGCFDILHIGHVRYLRMAKALGDCLIVGINTDDSVRQIKGPERPLVPELERAEVLAALEFVDYVSLFSELTPVKLILELKPDIHVKGGDYTIDKLPEADAVRSYGGRIVILPLVEGKSTSRLIAEVQARKQTEQTLNKYALQRTVGIIPSRLAATRLPNKPLLDIAGKPMIRWVYEKASRAHLINDIVVATPDEEIKQCVESFGGKAIMTSETHRSGTDRVAEAAKDIDADIIVNIQGDEPLLDPSAVDSLVRVMLEDSTIPMASLMCPLSAPEEAENPAVVKVVTDQQGFALYFSRSGIPYPRHPEYSAVRKHIGIYAYRRDFLFTFASLDPTPLEKTESLEQLRALEHGYKIKMVETSFSPTSVDTLEDLEVVRRLIGGEE
ncbi:MAG: 3-deoxy-manno-octulosonate cytidylyltransferase [Armatimonadota bacterium]|nr:3-deoxy-manno-octulosonate cytidylyltransferase [Armatimonadota bacterium]